MSFILELQKLIKESSSHLKESYSASQDAVENYYDKLDSKMEETLKAIIESKPTAKQPWTPLRINRLQKIWRDFSRFQIVRDERGIEDIADDFIDKIITINANTIIAGHTSEDPKDYAERYEIEWTDEVEKKIDDSEYINTEGGYGSWRISDYALKPLQDAALKLLDAKTAEEKLLILDSILNIVHQRSDIASWFVQGGRNALDQLSKDENITESLKPLKVGSWWNNFDDKQKKAFTEIYYKSQFADIQSMRKFFSAAKKKFGDSVEYLKDGLVKVNGKKYAYSHDTNSWNELKD